LRNPPSRTIVLRSMAMPSARSPLRAVLRARKKGILHALGGASRCQRPALLEGGIPAVVVRERPVNHHADRITAVPGLCVNGRARARQSQSDQECGAHRLNPGSEWSRITFSVGFRGYRIVEKLSRHYNGDASAAICPCVEQLRVAKRDSGLYSPALDPDGRIGLDLLEIPMAIAAAA